jgi:hypothetical protein
LGSAFDGGAAGKAEVEELGDLVEGFAGGVVERAAEKVVLERTPADVEMGVAAGDDKADAGVDGGVGIGELGGVEMSLEVVELNQGDVEREGERLGGSEADDEGADESGAGGDGDGPEVGERDAGLGKGFVNDGKDLPDVGAGGDLWDYAAEAGMEVELGGDDVGEDARDAGALVAGTFKHRSAGFVAGGLEGEDEQALERDGGARVVWA